MLPIIFFILGGAAIAGTIIPDESNDDIDDTSDGNEDLQSEGDLTGLGQLLDNSPEVIEGTPEAEEERLEVNGFMGEVETLDSAELRQQLDSESLEGEVPSGGGVEITVDDSSIFPSALTDWSTSDSVPVLNLGQTEALVLSFPEGDLGSIAVLDADFFEKQAGTEGMSIVEHTGTNVYYVPSGEEFPENYAWSNEGAVLFDTSDYLNDPDDFGGIKLIARVDSGSALTGLDSDGQTTVNFDDRIGDPVFISNLEISYI